MAKAQRKPIPEETFLEYFGMQRAPFGPPLEPLEIFDCEQYSLLNDRLVSATEVPGSLAVFCGVDGSGKTTLLNRYVANLPEETAYARFDETCKTGKQFYFDFLKQLGFDEISGTLREFRNITREFLKYQGTAGNCVLLLVDNAHLVKPSVLEQLRWISATRVKDRKVLSVVLAGNFDLLRIMESPAMRSLKFDHRADFNIRVYTESETEAYMWHCLNASGGTDVAKFSNAARAMIYRYTGGIPGKINALCNATLAEACAQENRVIHDKLVRVVADKEKMLPHAVLLKSKRRRKTDKNCTDDAAAEEFKEQSGVAKTVLKEAGTKRKSKTKALIQKLEESLVERDARIAELEAGLDIYATDLAIVRAQLRAQTGLSQEQYSLNGAVLSFEVLKNGNYEQLVEISQGQFKVMIGRADECELRLGGRFVSRHHALIVLTDGGVFVEDLKSFNGTIVNGRKITRHQISPGDKIKIGDYELRTSPA